MTYGHQLSQAGAGFGQTFGDGLDQPAQIKAGVSFNISNNITLTADYKLIQWSSATGYKQFGWNDENVVAIGGKYTESDYWIGLGYNSSNNPIGTFTNGVATNRTNGQNGVGNFFNNLMFPAIAQNSYTVGGGYNLNKNFELDGSYVMSPKVTTKVDISDSQGLPAGSFYNTTTHSQQSYLVSLRYKF
jgi:long-chain fatty acid transport protein